MKALGREILSPEKKNTNLSDGIVGGDLELRLWGQGNTPIFCFLFIFYPHVKLKVTTSLCPSPNVNTWNKSPLFCFSLLF